MGWHPQGKLQQREVRISPREVVLSLRSLGVRRGWRRKALAYVGITVSPEVRGSSHPWQKADWPR